MENVKELVRRRASGLVRRLYARPGAVRRILVGPGSGLRLEVTAESSIHSVVGTAELELARHVRRLAAPGAVCFDIGCHDGYYAMVFARRTGATVVAFEADPTSVTRIRRNLARNPTLSSKVVIVGGYVSDETAQQPDAVTLDSLLRDDRVPAPSLLKIDVDGSETAVLSGARHALATIRPSVIVEVHSPELERDCAELLRAAGYRVCVVPQRKRFRQNRPAPHNRWLVATHSDSR